MVERWQLTIKGRVQGLGFRPFVYCLAKELGLSGWVGNSAQGVFIEIQASVGLLQCFMQRLEAELPPHAQIDKMLRVTIPVQPDKPFVIQPSDGQGLKSALILPDLAICADCLREIMDPTNRRYQYPFTNCTHCGPRYSIIESLPYDRPNTTMRHFTMCPACRAEYEDPHDRRFHAQPNACPVCGPQLSLWDRQGQTLAKQDSALCQAAALLREGQILALKGLGGFQLMVDARHAEAVGRLRHLKGRYEKPLALMVHDLAMAQSLCEIDSLEREFLCSAAAPIVLLAYRGVGIAPNVAPEQPNLGLMLPYTPLHALLLKALDFPLVATSANLSGEPICIDEMQALARLGGIADAFLVHDRPIARHVDDSVMRVAAGQMLMLRRARGYAPLPIAAMKEAASASVIATGAHQKNTVALLHDERVFLSQHLGDMDNPENFSVFKRSLADLQNLYGTEATHIVCDMHPDYVSTTYAQESGLALLQVQHHVAHVLACMAEHQLEGPVLGIAWDGTGYGPDGTIWGGECLLITPENITRVAHLRPFPLPGGDTAAREPRRSLLGLLYASYGADLPQDRLAFAPAELALLLSALERGINCPLTSSIGRLFDAVAALAGLHQRCSYEGQAAMALENLASGINTDKCYPFEITPVTNANRVDGGIIEVSPMLKAMMQETVMSVMSAKFHNTLAQMTLSLAQRAGIQQIVLTGGCFQNRLLLEGSIAKLQAAGFTVYWPQQIPPNDGGIALGQITAALREGHYVFSSSRTVDQHER